MKAEDCKSVADIIVHLVSNLQYVDDGPILLDKNGYSWQQIMGFKRHFVLSEVFWCKETNEYGFHVQDSDFDFAKEWIGPNLGKWPTFLSMLEGVSKKYAQKWFKTVTCETNINTDSGETLARMMRGVVPEWDDTYIEKYVPPDILARVKKEIKWTDEDGFNWGWYSISAHKLEYQVGDLLVGTPVVVVATRYDGQGYHTQKVVDTNGNMYEIHHG